MRQETLGSLDLGFKLLKHFIYDHDTKRYLMVGVVGDGSSDLIRTLDVTPEIF